MSSSARRTAPSSSTPVAMLRRVPPLPGQVVSWPPSPVMAAVQGALALDTVVPVPAEAAPHLTAVPDDPEDSMRARAARFVTAVVEGVGGDRPVRQLMRWTTPEVYDDLAEQAEAVAWATNTGARARTERPRLVSLRVSYPTDDVAEVCGHVRHGCRGRAVALRLEQHLDHWVCTAIQLG